MTVGLYRASSRGRSGGFDHTGTAASIGWVLEYVVFPHNHTRTGGMMRAEGSLETRAEGVSEERDERCEMRDVRVAREKIMKI